MIFVTCAYGKKYGRFLLPHLYSVVHNYPEAKIIVLWNDLLERDVCLLKSAFKNTEFIKVDLSVNGNIDQVISFKTNFLARALALAGDGIVCFLDCDTLVYKRFDWLLKEKFDVVYTWKNEKFPLNTGVLVLRNSDKTKCFVQEWADRTNEIIRDKKLLAKACAVNGAADQQSLMDILASTQFDKQIIREVHGHSLLFKGINCEYLNEIRSTPITDKTHIIHYKSGWHPILLDGQEFTTQRPEESSRMLFDFWKVNLKFANKYFIKNIVFNSCQSHLRRFKKICSTFEERGILNSEMLSFCSICDVLGVDIILESGRYRGQSTLVLAKFFKDSGKKIISIDLVEDDNTIHAQKKLEKFADVELIYGDGTKIIPQLVKKFKNKKVAVLLDGPKGKLAVDLMDFISTNENFYFGAIHDVKSGSESRVLFPDYFKYYFLTDQALFVKKYQSVDNSCLPKSNQITEQSWRPYMKGFTKTKEYGPTLGLVFPLYANCGKNNYVRFVLAFNAYLFKVKSILRTICKRTLG